MRPHQWVKNLVVLAAPMFALQFDARTLLLATSAFLLFSFTASGFYLVNDIMDIKADRQHPVKCQRPIAAGKVPIPVAKIATVICLANSQIVSFTVAPLLGVTVSIYAVVQVGYNLRLKHEPILDIMCIAVGFVLRYLAGAAATAVPVSSWSILSVGLLALYLAIEKRKAELKSLGESGKTRKVLQHYSLPWLLRMESVVTSCTLMAYSLWTIEGTKTSWMLATTPFVAYGIFKYQALSEQGEGEAPDKILLSNPQIWVTVVLWAMTSIFILKLST